MKKENQKHLADELEDESFTEDEEAADKDLDDLEHEELSGTTQEAESLTQTETDEDVDEGLGDGNLGKSREGTIDR